MSSSAFLTAAITNAENVQSLPCMAFSTSSMMSLGKRMVLFVVGGIDGILKFPMPFTSQYVCLAYSVKQNVCKICIAFAMRQWYNKVERSVCHEYKSRVVKRSGRHDF